MSLLQSFIRRVERFLVRHGLAASRFGKEAANDPNFVFDLRSGRRPNTDLIESVDNWMRAYREQQIDGGKKRAPSQRVEPRAA